LAGRPLTRPVHRAFTLEISATTDVASHPEFADRRTAIEAR